MLNNEIIQKVEVTFRRRGGARSSGGLLYDWFAGQNRSPSSCMIAARNGLGLRASIYRLRPFSVR